MITHNRQRIAVKPVHTQYRQRLWRPHLLLVLLQVMLLLLLLLFL